MKKLVIGVMVVGAILLSGCSMLSYSSSKDELIKVRATQRAMASGDQNVIKAVAMGNTVAAGVDLLDPNMWDVIAQHPVRAGMAALVDLATAAAATYAVTATIDRSHHDTATVSISGSGNSMNYNNGNGNSNSGTTTTGNSNATPGNDNTPTSTDSHNQ